MSWALLAGAVWLLVAAAGCAAVLAHLSRPAGADRADAPDVGAAMRDLECAIDPNRMRPLPSPWEAYFGVHNTSAAALAGLGCRTVRGCGGPHLGLPRDKRGMGRDEPVRKGPFTGATIRVGLKDMRRHAGPGRRSLDQLIPEIIANKVTAIYIGSDLIHPSTEPFDKDLAYWALRLIHERFPEADRHVLWQWGNEVNGLHFDPTNIKARIKKTGESKWKFANTPEKRELYVAGFLAPAIETTRKVSRDVYGQRRRIKIVSGSFANIYNPAYRKWMYEIMDHKISGPQAPTLKGDRVWQHVDLLTVHYPFARGNGAEVMQEIHDKLLKTGKVESIWITEEHGGRGKGPVTIVDRGLQFIDWVAANRLNARQTRLVWWGANHKKAGGRAIEAVEALGRFLAGSRLRVLSERQGNARVYTLVGQEKQERVSRIMIAIIPDASSALAVRKLILSLPAQSQAATWSARALQFSSTDPPVEWDTPVLREGVRLSVTIGRQITEPFVLFLKASP